MNIVAVKKPETTAELEDLATLTNAVAVTKEKGIKEILPEHAGIAARVVVTKDRTVLVGVESTKEAVQKRIDEAAQLGYIVLAFGLRLRCPLLQNTIRKSSYQARGTSEDERTLGNAIGQSYGQLNNRAMVAFMNHVWNSKYKYEIFPIAPIHDASYYVSNDDLDAIMFINKYLITEMQWQEDHLIAHDRVKIGAELDVAYPSWAYPFTIPNGADDKTITELKEKHLAKLKKDGVI